MGDKYEIRAWGFDTEINDYGWVREKQCSTWAEAQPIFEEWTKEFQCVQLTVRTGRQGLI